MRIQSTPVEKSSSSIRGWGTIRVPLIVAGALLLALGVFVLFRFSKGKPLPVSTAAEPESNGTVSPMTSSPVSADPAARPPATLPRLRAVRESVAGAPMTLAGARTLVTNLTQLDPQLQNVTPELIAWWRG